ncbi:MAG: ketopantoate reductase C-terminal domain-containing protein, partial [Anaerolineae bacterium]
PTRVYEDFRALKWTKLLMNQLANATCAILGWLPAQVMADPRLADLEIAAWRETLAVMAAQRIRPVTLGGYPFPWLAPLIRTLPPAVIRLALGRLVGGARGGKAPSLYLDLAAGKGRTEVAYLNGAVAAASAEIRTPVNRVLTETLQALSAGQTPWAQWRDQPARLLQRVQEARR